MRCPPSTYSLVFPFDRPISPMSSGLDEESDISVAAGQMLGRAKPSIEQVIKNQGAAPHALTGDIRECGTMLGLMRQPQTEARP